jgi:ubiquinone biosynthesis protein Coq4
LIVASGVLVSAAGAAARPAPVARRQDLADKRRQQDNRKNNLRSLYATYKLAKRPDQVKYVFMMGDAQDNIAEGERAAGRITDPFACVALETMWQQRFCPQRYDIAELLRLPADSLGGAYARHMKAHGLRRMRLRQTHEVWHVVSGFGTDEFGEVGLQGFYFAQFTNGQSALIGAGAMLKSLLRGRFGDLEKHVDAFCQGYCAGKRAESLLAVKWEELWTESLEGVRRRYRIEPPRCRAGTLPAGVSG